MFIILANFRCFKAIIQAKVHHIGIHQFDLWISVVRTSASKCYTSFEKKDKRMSVMGCYESHSYT